MDSSVGALLGLVLLLVIFLIARELVCWYWKINDMVAIQTKQLLILTALLDSQRMDEAQRGDFIKRALDAIEATK